MLAPKPANLSFEQAAAVPISGSTALQAVRKAKVQPGQHVLIVGASGGVGTLRRPDRQGVRRRGHRRLQHRQGRPRPLPRRRPRHRLHAARTSPPASSATTSSSTPAATAGCHISDASMTRRGTLVIVGGETGGRWLGGFERSLAGGAAVAAREPEAEHARLDGERRRPDTRCATSSRPGRSSRRSTAPTRSARPRAAIALRPGRSRTRQGRHHDVRRSCAPFVCGLCHW